MTIFNPHMVADFSKRYLTNVHLESFLKRLNPEIFNQSIAGYSVENRPIYRLDFGSGSFKILLWSQMHGNETTTTKAVIDLLNELNSNLNSNWLSIFSFTFLPLLNPDGAENYTRVNANQVDLNRDSIELSQPESRVLREIIEEVKPNLALNMHDQRTIFAAGITKNPATLSFLAPSYNESREINTVRTYAMQLIAMMHNGLKEVTSLNIGRFDDSFNVNCIGDMFTHLGTPTILFEAGFAKNDYQRHTATKWVEQALMYLFDGIIKQSYQIFSVEDYMKIPQNHKNFVDLIIYNFTTTNSQYKHLQELPIIFKECVRENLVVFEPTIDLEAAPSYQFAHYILNANNQLINTQNDVDLLLKDLVVS